MITVLTSLTILGMAPISIHPIVLLALIVVALGAVGITLFRVDTKIEQRRTVALDIAAWLSAYGFVLLPAMLHMYAIGDYSGLFEAAKSFAKMLADPVRREQEFDGVFRKILEARLKNVEQRGATLKLIEDFKAANAIGTTDVKKPPVATS